MCTLHFLDNEVVLLGGSDFDGGSPDLIGRLVDFVYAHLIVVPTFIASSRDLILGFYVRASTEQQFHDGNLTIVARNMQRGFVVLKDSIYQ